MGAEPVETSEPPRPTATPRYRYVGTVTINLNPFEYEDEEPAVIKLILTQDGKSQTVFNGTLSYKDFPKKFTVNGWSDSTGQLTISKAGVVLDPVFDIEFKRIAD